MALTTCPECSAEISDLAKACPNCGAPLVPDAAQEHNRLLAIDAIAKRRYRPHGIGLTVVVFLLTVFILERLFEGYPGNATWLIFFGALFAAHMAKLTLYALMSRKIGQELSPEELRAVWLQLGGFE